MDQFDDQVVIPAIAEQLGFSFDVADHSDPQGRYFTAHHVDLDSYDSIVLCMSGGKDSIACLLHLLDSGVDKTKLELWHHDVDGREGSTLMDWPFMADYNRKLAAAFNLPIYFSWLQHGFEGELLKENSFSHPHHIETPNGLMVLERDSARTSPSTRLKFPQVGANLQTRWCSSALKIDVGRRAITNQSRFEGQRTLFITGERREESSNRARYNQLEPHTCDRRDGKKARHVDVWRPVLHWSEVQVWDILQRHGVIAPLPYRLGWGRSSCMKCIFNDDAIWATLQHHFPGSLQAIAGYEKQFGTTISRKRIPILDLARQAQPLKIDDPELLKQAMQPTYTLPIIGHKEDWRMPAGAFNKSGCGPS